MTVCCLSSFLFYSLGLKERLQNWPKWRRPPDCTLLIRWDTSTFMTLRNLPPVKSHRKVRFCRFIVLKLNKRCLFEVIEVGFFYIDSAENFWRAHTSRVTGYVTYTSHQNSRIFLLPHLFLPFQRVQEGEGGSKEDRSVELKCWLLGCSDD